MTDKVQKIREEVEKLKSQLLRGACSSQIAMETICKEEAYNEVLAILDSMQKEPVSEDLESEIKLYYVDLDEHPEYVQTARHFAKWQKEQIRAKAENVEISCASFAPLSSGNYRAGDKLLIIKEE